MFVLILMMTLGMDTAGGITNVPGFKTDQQCEAAGQLIVQKVKKAGPAIDYVCIKQ